VIDYVVPCETLRVLYINESAVKKLDRPSTKEWLSNNYAIENHCKN